MGFPSASLAPAGGFVVPNQQPPELQAAQLLAPGLGATMGSAGSSDTAGQLLAADADGKRAVADGQLEIGIELAQEIETAVEFRR